jgi:hypothetical protein
MKRIIVATALWMSAIAPATVQAADPPQTYVVPVCSTARDVLPDSGWTNSGAPGDDECASGGGFGGTAAFGDVEWGYIAPEDTQIVAIRLWRDGAATDGAGYIFGAREQGLFSNVEATDELRHGPVTAREYDGLHASELHFGVYCFVESCAPAEAWVRFTRIEMVFRDDVNPRVTEATGTALAPSPVAGTADIQASFADVGGGVRDTALLVDGVEFLRRPPRCTPPYASAVPCPLKGTEDISLDTRAISDGNHTLSFAVTDVAGNRSVSKPYEIAVDNVPDPVVELPAPPVVRISPEWLRIDGTYGKSPVVRATLRDPAGAPVGGLKVGVAVRSAVVGAPFVLDTPVFSDAKGRVAVRLPRGPSREVKLTLGGQTAVVSVVVPAPLRFAATPANTRNGRSIRLYGSIPGTEATTAVELQAQSGKKWVPFKTVHLRDGRFNTRYRFLRTFATTRYRFRAVVHGDTKFPYAPATSNVKTVLVRP